MRINQLYNKLILDEMWVYKNPVFRPFIDYYYKSNQKSKFKLFHAYCFQFNKMHEMYKERDYLDETYFLPNGELNFKKKKVRKMFYPHNLAYFIGYSHKLYSIFLHLTLTEDNTDDLTLFYDFTGYMSCNEFHENDYS
jgi:hypothetical protein